MKRDSMLVQLRGNPDRLTTVLHLPQTASTDKPSRRSASCAVNLPGVAVRRARIRELDPARPGFLELRIKLPVSTPPGTYQGKVQVGDKELPIVVDVEPRPRLRLFPRRLRGTVAPGSVLNANLTIANIGNDAVN